MNNKTLSLPLILLAVISSTFAGCSKQEEPSATSAPASESSSMSPQTAENNVTETAPAESMQDSAANSSDISAESFSTTSADKDAKPESTPVQTTTDAGATQSEAVELTLARKSGCLACHSVDKKIVGPAWRDVSKRYKGDPDAKARLIAKVSKGGSGNWKEVVGTAAMPPYSPRVSDENIAKLVEFVLSLEK